MCGRSTLSATYAVTAFKLPCYCWQWDEWECDTGMAVLVVVVGVPRLYLSSSFEGPLCYSCGSRGAVCAISGHTFTTRVVCTDKPAIMAKWRFHGVTGSPLHFMCTVSQAHFVPASAAIR